MKLKDAINSKMVAVVVHNWDTSSKQNIKFGSCMCVDKIFFESYQRRQKVSFFDSVNPNSK